MKPVAEMSEAEKAQVREWFRRWERVGPILERLKAESLPSVSTAASIEAFELAYQSARLHAAPRLWSGLIEQQAWFRRARS